MQKQYTEIEIKPRKMDFQFATVNDAYWYGGSPLISTFVTALFITFPGGEQQFIRSVRHYQDRVKDPALKAQIDGFVSQEGHHSAQHRAANRQLDTLGIPVAHLERGTTRHIRRLYDTMTPAQSLALTVCLEHITAIVSEFLLSNPDKVEPMPEALRELVLWHAVEEIEHKSVAFDVYMECVGDRRLLRNIMRVVSVQFLYRMSLLQYYMLKQKRDIPSPKDFVRYGKFMLGKKGLLRDTAGAFREFFRKDFHPWDQDNIELIEDWKLAFAGQVEG